MPAYIEAAATCVRRGVLFGRGALHLADHAAEACLDRSHHEADELDLLINTGIYKDHNAAEPALASIIQDDVGANRAPVLGRHGTFSFDLFNGGAGFVTAAEVASGFVGNGGARLAMIVAADADPSPRTSRNYPFMPAGGAVMLAQGELGFERFTIRTFAEDASLFISRLVWDPRVGLHGRNVVEVVEAPAFAGRCVERAVEVARAMLADAGLRPEQVDLLIASQYPIGFPFQVARALGIPPDHVPEVKPELVGSHTAGPIGALEAAITTRRLTRARHVLFVTAGAGTTIAVAWYRGWD
jgi:3-oxoacyl-[acyl-carrier-protein] synthase-3